MWASILFDDRQLGCSNMAVGFLPLACISFLLWPLLPNLPFATATCWLLCQHIVETGEDHPVIFVIIKCDKTRGAHAYIRNFHHVGCGIVIEVGVKGMYILSLGSRLRCKYN